MGKVYSMTIEYKDSKRISALSTDILDTLTIDENFSDVWNKIGTGVTVSGGEATWNVTGNQNNQISKAIGSTLSDTTWVAQFEIELSAYSGGEANILALSSGTALTGQNSTDDTILVRLNDTGKYNVSFRTGNGTDYSYVSTIDKPANGTRHYLTLVRNSSTEAILYVRTVSHTGTQVTNSPHTVTQATMSGATGLDTVTQGGWNTGNSGRTLTMVGDNLKIYNGMTTPSGTATFEDDYSNDSAWTDVGSNGVTGGHLQLNPFLNGTDNTTYRAITALSDTAFVMRFSFTPVYTGHSSGNSSQIVWFGLASGTGNAATTQNWVILGIEGWTTAERKLGAYALNGTAVSQFPSSSNFMSFTSGTTYYCQITRDGDDFTFNIYDDSAYSSQVGTVTRTVSSFYGLDTLIGTNWVVSGSNNATATNEIDDVKIYDGVTSLTNKPTNVQDNSILVEKDIGNRYWFDAESNATVTKDYPMTTDPRTNTFNTSGVTTITHANSTLQLNQMNSSSSMGASTYIDLGSDLSTKWVMRFRTNQSGYTNYAYNSQMQVGMSSVAPTSTAYNISSSLNWIGFRWYFGTQFSATYQGIEPRIGQNTGDNTHNNSTARLYGNPNNTTNTGTSYYHEFIWNVDTFTYNLYDNANYTGTKLATAIMSSSTNTNWVTGTPSSVSGLRYLVFKIGADTNGGLWVNQLDDVKIYDGVTSVTTPATWTMEPTFEDDFTSYADQTAADLAWVSQETASTRVNVTNDNLAFSVTGTSNKGISYDLGVGNVSDTTWILQYTLAHTTYTNGSGYGQYWIGLSSADSATLYGGAQDSISSRYNRDTAMRVEASDNSDMGNQGGTDGVDLANNTTYYVDLIRDGTSITRNIYTDSARTGTIFSTSTLTISGTITGLRYFVLRNDSASGTSGHATGTIDDIKFYNGVTTPN